MDSEDYIEVEVYFLKAEDGGHRQPPDLTTGCYRPHFRVSPYTEMLGVEFVSESLNIQAGVSFRTRIRLLYAPEVDYTLLTVGTHFDVLEGPKVVGHGFVIR